MDNCFTGRCDRSRQMPDGLRDIYTFYFLLKSKMDAKSGENLKFYPLHQIPLYFVAKI